MEQISIGNATTLANVNSWLRGSASEIHIRLTRESDVLPFAEGPALNAIATLRKRHSKIHVSTTFDLDLRDDNVDFGCFETIFGLQLLYDSVEVRDSRGTEIRSELLNALWGKVIKAGGCLGSHGAQYIFFRDPDYVVPQCLGTRDISPAQGFPAILKRVAKGLSSSKRFGGRTDEDLLRFLYEAATNANEHGARSKVGVRGITVRKMIFNTEDELQRRDRPDMLREFCERRWMDRKRPLLLLSFSVSDLGPGIQNTLPPLAGESPRERLARAFRDGVSCKPTGGDTKRGLGLSKILESASSLKALLIVTSANLLAYRDFTKEWTEPKSDFYVHSRELTVPAGTSLTLVLMPERVSPDQQTLSFS